MYLEINDKIRQILDDLPDESAEIDYKIIPYNSGEQGEFIKDLCGFLNSIDGFGRDKYIIFGVANNKYRKGIMAKKMWDDNIFQNLAEHIYPKPSIRTNKIKYIVNGEEKIFGYVFIPFKKNMNLPYSLIKSYPDPDNREITKLLLEDKNISNAIAGRGYIRYGSKTSILNEQDRDKISKLIPFDYNIKHPYLKKENSLKESIIEKSFLKKLILIGAWDENLIEDRLFISELTGKPYEEISTFMKKIVKNEEAFYYSSGEWIFKNRIEILKENADCFYLEDFTGLEDSLTELFREYDEKYELGSDKRIMSGLLDENKGHSRILKKSTAQLIPEIKSIKDLFINLEQRYLDQLIYSIVCKVLNINDWKVWATLDEYLPLFAEAEPYCFLKVIENNLYRDSDVFIRYITEIEYNIIQINYTQGLYNSLELMAWDPSLVVRVSLILSKIYEYDKSSLEIMIKILIPWNPQTKASRKTKQAVITNLVKENELFTKKLLHELMPNKRTSSVPSYKPLYLGIVGGKTQYLIKDYLDDIDMYFKKYLEIMNSNYLDIKQLINLINHVSSENKELILNTLKDTNKLGFDDNEIFEIWCSLEDLISKHKKYNELDWAFKGEDLKELIEISSKIKPTSIITHRRLFRKDTWLLENTKIGYEESIAALNKERFLVLKQIYEKSFISLINFIKTIEDSYVAGILSAGIDFLPNQEVHILAYLESKSETELKYAQGYVFEKNHTHKLEWFDTIDFSKMSKQGISNFLITLPPKYCTWLQVTKLLGKDERKYWSLINIRNIENKNDLEYAVTKLMEYDRFSSCFYIIFKAIYDGVDFNREISKKLLLNFNGDSDDVDSHYIKTMIKDLQENEVLDEILLSIEWKYLPLLHTEEFRPITIESFLIKNPSYFVSLLSYQTNPKEKLEKNQIFNIYRAMEYWKNPPGFENGEVDNEKFISWLDEVKNLSIESNVLDYSLNQIGKVLYRSRDIKEPLWINKHYADILNEPKMEVLRNGFTTEIINSRGVISVDKEGKIYKFISEEYEDMAERMEWFGYSRIATAVRSVARIYFMKYKSYSKLD